MSDVRGDIRFAWRSLRREPGFLAVVLATIALGVGTTTAMFTVVNGVLLRPLAYPNPAALNLLEIRGGDGGRYPLPDADFLALRAASPQFEHTAVFTGTSFSFTGSGTPEIIRGAWVSGEFFAALGLQPDRGRFLTNQDDTPGAPDLIVVSRRFWTQKLGGDPSIVGRTIRLDDRACTVIGVAPPEVTLPESDVDIWRNLAAGPPSRRGPFYLTGLVRLGPGTTIASARTPLDQVARALVRQYGGPADWRFELRPLAEATVGDARTPLYLLMGAVSLLLLIAVANVANLILARASSRQRELAVRAALGASRGRIAAQLLTEAALIGAVGGAIGLAIATWLTRAIVALAERDIPRPADVHMDVTVLLFAAGVSAVATLLFGVAPALHGHGDRLADPLREGARAGTGRARRRLQRTFVVVEIALALVLSVGAGLLVRSLLRLQQVDPGFHARQVVTFRLDLPTARYPEDPSVFNFFERLVPVLEAVPGVRSAAYGLSLPPDQLMMTDNFTVEGKVFAPNESAPVAPLVMVSGGYFRTLGVPLLGGRVFDQRDRTDSEKVVVISRSLADRYYPNGDAIGRQLKLGGPERPKGPWMRIVGIVGDVRFDGLAADAGPAFYIPFSQVIWRSEYFVVQTAVDPASIVPALRKAVWSLDPNLPVARVRTADQLLSAATAAPRFRTLVLAGFGALGLLLAIVGVYGVMSYAVSLRMHEMGVRSALGARRGDLFRLVLADAGMLTAIGICLGLAGAWWGARAARSVLFGVAPDDPVTLAIAAAVLIATALLASWIPARRAARVSPLT
ncbi:MAG TPA: ABC transporter permease, partial [Vicinamibacterales bacterium]|nr:ABC transporter permease [Vicinamibacterales bacterium]